MYVKSFIFALLFFFVPKLVDAQTFVYSYTDPCTGLVKNLNIPTNGITVTYFGQIQTFQPVDFTNGNFNTWANNVYSSYGGNNPCGSILGVSTSVGIAQQTAINFISIINNISAISDLQSSIGGATDILGGALSATNNEKKEQKKNKKSDNQSGGTNQSPSNNNGSNTSNSTVSGSVSGNSNSGQTGQNSNNSQSQVNNNSQESTNTTPNNQNGSGQNGSTNQSTNSNSSNSSTSTNGVSSNSSSNSGESTTNTNSSNTSGANVSNSSNSNATSGSSNSTSNNTPVNSASNGSSNNTNTNGTSNNTSNNSGSSNTNNTSNNTNGSNSSNTNNTSNNTNGSNSGANNTSNNTNGSNSGANNTSNNTNGSNNTSPNNTSSNTSNGSNNQPSSSEQNGSTNNQTPSNESNSQSTSTNNGNQNQSNNSGNGQGNGEKAPDNTSNADAAKEEKKTNILGGTLNSVQSASGKSEGGKPTVVLSSDFAGFNFKEGEMEFGGKGTAGFTSMNWNGTKTHGFLLDYTSVIQGPNLTAFFGNITKRRIDLVSLTGTKSFVGRGSMYGTLAVGQMWSFPKVKSLKLIYLATASFGNVYEEKFLGTALISGGMYDWKVSKRIDVKMMGLFIYAPYVSYYNDILLKSPYVIMPIIGSNIGITKKFKLNINFGGAYAINENVMNYTLMFGTRMAL